MGLVNRSEATVKIGFVDTVNRLTALVINLDRNDQINQLSIYKYESWGPPSLLNDMNVNDHIQKHIK